MVRTSPEPFCFPQARWGEVDGDAPGRHDMAAVLDGGDDALAPLLDRPLRQPDGVERGDAAGHVRLNRDEVGVDAEDGAGEGTSEHGDGGRREGCCVMGWSNLHGTRETCQAAAQKEFGCWRVSRSQRPLADSRRAAYPRLWRVRAGLTAHLAGRRAGQIVRFAARCEKSCGTFRPTPSICFAWP